MDLIQANILNKYCNDHPEALLVITQANRSISVYYENKKGNISHKFGGVKKYDLTKELEPGQVWVNLAMFKESYTKLIKYFHPDYYRGKQPDGIIKSAIEVLSQLSRTTKTFEVGTIHEILSSLDNKPPHIGTEPMFAITPFLGVLRARDPIQELSNWVENYRWNQISHYNNDRFIEMLYPNTKRTRNTRVEGRGDYSYAYQ